MNKLVVINACVRQADSRTLRIAEPLISALGERYEITRYDLPEEAVEAKISACIDRGLELVENW